jgi:hypothetical protein
MSVIPQTLELQGGLAPWALYQGSALDPLGTLNAEVDLEGACGPCAPSKIRKAYVCFCQIIRT